ncbi:MAG: DUF4355 domain-containing protein [Clostridia bacterium]|nr:DUF4355 domain-containing protein [Clostridia bacterium]
MAEFKKIETQEEFDKIVSERLHREREQVKSEFLEQIESLKKENIEIKSENAEHKTALEKLSEKDFEIENLKGQIKGYEKSELKRKIALENKIPYKLAERIKGETEDEMLEDAKNLSTYFEEKLEVPPLKNPEINTGKEDGYSELLQGLNLQGE